MRKALVSLLSGCWLAMAAGTACAQAAQPLAADPVLEARVMAVAEELRCMVCQNETIAASQADLAKDLRAQIRSQLQQGQSPTQILDFMVVRYGEFVLYRPPLKATTLALWGGPFALLLAAGVWLVRRLRHSARQREVALSPDELRRVQRLLETERSR